jgi:hypothetical protein
MVPIFPSVHTAGPVLRALGIGEIVPHIVEKRVPGLRQPRAVRLPVEQLQAERSFESMDLAGKGGLGDMQAGRRLTYPRKRPSLFVGRFGPLGQRDQ